MKRLSAAPAIALACLCLFAVLLPAAAPASVRGSGHSGSTAATVRDPLRGRSALAPDFSIAASPTSATTAAGGAVTYALSWAADSGYVWGSTFSITVSGLPGYTAYSHPGGKSPEVWTITTGAATLPGTYPLVFSATDGKGQHTVSVSLVVTANPTQATPPSQTTTPKPPPTPGLIALGQTLPAARSGQTYLWTLKAEGGTPPYLCVPQSLGVGSIHLTSTCRLTGTAPVVKSESITGPFRFKVKDSSSPPKTSEFPSMNFTVVGPQKPVTPKPPAVPPGTPKPKPKPKPTPTPTPAPKPAHPFDGTWQGAFTGSITETDQPDPFGDSGTFAVNDGAFEVDIAKGVLTFYGTTMTFVGEPQIGADGTAKLITSIPGEQRTGGPDVTPCQFAIQFSGTAADGVGQLSCKYSYVANGLSINGVPVPQTITYVYSGSFHMTRASKP